MKNTITQKQEDYILNLREEKEYSLSGDLLVQKLHKDYLEDKHTDLLLDIESFALVLLG